MNIKGNKAINALSIPIKPFFKQDSLPILPNEKERILSLLKLYSIEIRTEGEGPYFFYDQDRIKLSCQNYSEHNFLPLEIDLGRSIRTGEFKNPKSGPLYKSVKKAKTIWDSTSGLMGDTVFFLLMGKVVTSFERNSSVALLLEDALFRLKKEEIWKDYESRLVFIPNDAREISDIAAPDIIFYDPMFPEIPHKTALSKKEMRTFSELVGDDNDSLEFLKWAIENTVQKVVVKRPIKAPVLMPEKLAHQYTGKAVRYDCYLGRFLK